MIITAGQSRSRPSGSSGTSAPVTERACTRGCGVSRRRRLLGWGDIGKDANGCGNGREPAGWKHGYRASDNKIDSIDIEVCRKDQEPGAQSCATKVWDNPRVAG